jgi:hypothetical protein
MDENDLKRKWQEAHSRNQEGIYDKMNIKKSLKMKHGRIISKVLTDMKLKIAGYSLILIILICLMIYALAYLGLNLSVNTVVLFSFIGLFFLIRTISEINRFSVLIKTANSLSVKESVLLFRKKLTRIKTFDFVSYLFYFYTLAIWSTCIYIKDMGGVKIFSWSNAFQVLMFVVISILLVIPWLIKYQHNQSYKELYSSLNDSVDFLNEAT